VPLDAGRNGLFSSNFEDGDMYASPLLAYDEELDPPVLTFILPDTDVCMKGLFSKSDDEVVFVFQFVSDWPCLDCCCDCCASKGLRNEGEAAPGRREDEGDVGLE